jgi:O-acetyl-ADP-ribose deacetylase (regulator of RNase III)
MELQTSWNHCDVYLHQGDITALQVDAIVNAANKLLVGGGGVDGAIHRRGGPVILQECRKIAAQLGGSLPTGQAVITSGGNLPARYVVHTVGPMYHEAERAPARLAAAYRNSLAVARQRGLKSIAFPCISTGAYGYPCEEACRVALAAVKEELNRHGGFERVIFCTFDRTAYDIYQQAFRRAQEPPSLEK